MERNDNIAVDDSYIYLDYNGTCPLDDEVRCSVIDAMKRLWENPSNLRGKGPACKAAIEESRRAVAKMINAYPEEIIFVSGGTEANNTVVYSALYEYAQFLIGVGRPYTGEMKPPLDSVPHIITTNVEHDSVAKLLDYLESKRMCQVTRIPVETPRCAVSEFAVMEAIRPNTCLITIMLANNETGVSQPVVEVSQLLKDVNTKRVEQGCPVIRLHTDAAQVIGKLVVDVREGNGVDFLTIVGHKFYGPRIGALFIRQGVPSHPLLYGGGQEKFMRPGTENTPMIVGLGKAAELVTGKLTQYAMHMKVMRDYLELRLAETFRDDEVCVNFQKERRLPNTSSVTFKCLNVTASDLLETVDRLVVGTGAACHSGSKRASAVLLACGIGKDAAVRTMRFSVGRGTTRLEIDDAIKELAKAIGSTGKGNGV